MNENIKQIVADFTKIPADHIHSETVIDRSVVANSILLHRMYANLAKEGVEINNYQQIKTYGDLLNKISVNNKPEESLSGNIIYRSDKLPSSDQLFDIGIDIEEIFRMPKVNDFREDEFYKMNFTAREISYCGLQPDQYASFTGLFAVKEAIVKADNYYKNIPFHKIFIDHLPDGKPVFKGFSISISHTENLAIAVAVKDLDILPDKITGKKKDTIKNSGFPLLSILAFLLAVIALIICLFK